MARRRHQKRAPSGIRPRYDTRAGKPTIIERKMSVNTTPIYSFTSSKIKFEFYNGQWHLNHNYGLIPRTGVTHSSYAGASNI